MSRTFYLALTLVPALAGAPVYALGIGGMRLQSALNQPFVGEIELLDVKPDELDSVKVQIAPQAEFNRAGTERYHYLAKLRFSPQLSPRGGPVIRVTSREPIREPYMDFLVEVQWPTGRLVKQFTLLLDPPVTSPRSAPRVEQAVAPARAPLSSAAVSEPSSPPIRSPQAPASSAPPLPAQKPPRAVPMASATADGLPKRLGPIRPGTGLWRLARSHTPAGATVSQTAMALYRSNPDAFINGDINRLMAGRTLILPPADELFALAPDAAQREFQAAMTGEPVRRGPMADPAAPGLPPLAGESRLKIAGTAPAGTPPAAIGAGKRPGAGGEGVEQELLLVREASESARQEAVEMRGRIRDLETQLSEIQQLLQLRNAELARIQVGGGVAPGTETAANTAGPSVGPAGKVPEFAAVDEQAPSNPLAQAAMLDADRPIDEPPAARMRPAHQPPAEGPPVSDAGVPVGAEGPQVSGTAAAGSNGSGTAPVAAPKPVPPRAVASDDRLGKAVTAAPPAGGDSTWRALLLPLAGVAAVTALGIGALTWLRSRRRVGADAAVEYDSTEAPEDRLIKPALAALATRTGLAAGPAEAAAKGEVGGAVGGEASEPAGALDTPSSAFATFGRSMPETDETDVISEADIYIAYGRFREAEELLLEEIRRSPNRLDLKFKLADAYYGANRTDALRDLMEAVRAAGGDQANPDQWQRLAELVAAPQPAVASAGSTVAPVQAPLPAAPLGSPADSMEFGPEGVYTLDIPDALHPPADLPLPSPLRPSEDPAVPSEPRPEGAPLSGRAASVPADLSPLSLDHPFFAGVDTGEDPDILNSNRDGWRPDERAVVADDQRFSRGVSDLELTIDDLRSSTAADIELFEGTTGTLNLTDDLTLPEGPVPAPDPAVSSGRSLDSGAVAPTGTAPSGHVQTDSTSSSDLHSSQWQMDSGLWDETATKLDLARAYVEMADKESARDILEEVVGEGSEEQRNEARELLLRIS